MKVFLTTTEFRYHDLTNFGSHGEEVDTTVEIVEMHFYKGRNPSSTQEVWLKDADGNETRFDFETRYVLGKD